VQGVQVRALIDLEEWAHSLGVVESVVGVQNFGVHALGRAAPARVAGAIRVSCCPVVLGCDGEQAVAAQPPSPWVQQPWQPVSVRL
jgi:hypothetical protein